MGQGKSQCQGGNDTENQPWQQKLYPGSSEPQRKCSLPNGCSHNFPSPFPLLRINCPGLKPLHAVCLPGETLSAVRQSSLCIYDICQTCASPSADLNQATALGSCHLNGPYTPVHLILMVLVFSFSFHLYFLSPHHLLPLPEHSYKHAFYLKKKEEPMFKVFSC